MFGWWKKSDDGRGRTKDSAIIISADNSAEGVDREYKELERRFGALDTDWVLLNRSHGTYMDKYIETFLIEYKDESFEVHFDISGWYGKRTPAGFNFLANKYMDGTINQANSELSISIVRESFLIAMLSLEQMIKSAPDGWFEQFYTNKNEVFNIMQECMSQIKRHGNEELFYKISLHIRHWISFKAIISTVRHHLSKDMDMQRIALDDVIFEIQKSAG